MPPEIRIVLNVEDLNCLVRGGELTIQDARGTVKMILGDVGYSKMHKTILEAAAAPEEQYLERTRMND